MKLYIQQSILEKELLYFGYEAFGVTFVDPVSEEIICYPSHFAYLMQRFHAAWYFICASTVLKDTWTPEDVMPKKLREKQK